MESPFALLALRARCSSAGRASLALGVGLLIAGGCASTSTPEERNVPRPLPEPAHFQINVTAEVHLPPALVAESGLPATLDVTVKADAHAEAISASPLRSRYAGTLSVIVIDDASAELLVNTAVDVSGEQAGPPDEALEQAVKRFVDAASLGSRSVNPLKQAGS